MNKFTLLKNLKQDPFWSKFIPDYYFLEEINKSAFKKNLFSNNEKYILRSSLALEGSKVKLLSGKSISIKNITDIDKLTEALTEIKSQSSLNEVILQKQIDFDNHYTIYLSKAVNYAEETFSESKKVLIFNDHYQVGSITFPNNVQKILKKLAYRFEDRPLLLEVGQQGDKFYFFQVNFVPKGGIEKIIQSNILSKLINIQIKYKKNISSINLIKFEFNSFLFRMMFSINKNRKRNFSFKNCFLNWQYIFHYYSLYLSMNKIHQPDHNSWLEFLNNHNKIPFVGTHFRLANIISKSLGFVSHTQAVERQLTQILVGQGQSQYSIAEDCYFCEKLTPDLVYNNSKALLITKDNHILSHSFLAASETKTVVLGNLTDKQWDEIKNSQFLQIDFEEKLIEVS